MTTMASRDLRNHTRRVLDEVARGGRVTITANGVPVADIVPTRAHRRRSMPAEEFLSRLRQADPGLRDDLADLTGDTTDDLGPIGQ